MIGKGQDDDERQQSHRQHLVDQEHIKQIVLRYPLYPERPTAEPDGRILGHIDHARTCYKHDDEQ